MLLVAARKKNATIMDYYEKRIEALKNILPDEYPYQFIVETDILGEDYPVTYITMKRFRKDIKTWVLVVTDDKMAPSDKDNQTEIIFLNHFSNWSKVKRFIRIQIQQVLKEIEEEGSFSEEEEA